MMKVIEGGLTMNNQIRKGFMYNSDKDKDIHDWLMSLPERHQSKHIRTAIRFYLEHQGEIKHTKEQEFLNKLYDIEQKIEQLKEDYHSDPVLNTYEYPQKDE